MSGKTIFADEWRECLREHYKYVMRDDPNPRNHTSVTKVLLRPNGEQPPIFTERELEQLYVEATMRADEMPDDFVPDLAVLSESLVEEFHAAQAADSPEAVEIAAEITAQVLAENGIVVTPDALIPQPSLFGDLLPAAIDERTFQPHPLECQCPQCIQINMLPHDEQGQPLTGEALQEHLEETQKGTDGGKKRRKKGKDAEQLSLF